MAHNLYRFYLYSLHRSAHLHGCSYGATPLHQAGIHSAAGLIRFGSQPSRDHTIYRLRARLAADRRCFRWPALLADSP